MQAPRRALVTGGAGFLGSHLCDQLIDRGDEVLCVDNLLTGRKANIRHLLDHPSFEFLRHDVSQPLQVEVDVIYHLACPASPVQYQSDPTRTIETALEGAIHLLHLARDVGAKILLASTSEVYGDPEVHPQTESYRGSVTTTGPRSCYDEGKRASETLFWDAHLQFGTRIRIARIFNTYGPRMRADDGRVVSTFLVQGLTGQPFTVYGDGSQTRSFCYVSDLIDGLIRLMDASDDAAGISEPVNLGNPEERTVLELVDAVRVVTGSTAPVVPLPLPIDDPVRRCPSIVRAQHLLGWRPVTPLIGGLRATAQALAEEEGLPAPPPPDASLAGAQAARLDGAGRAS